MFMIFTPRITKSQLGKEQGKQQGQRNSIAVVSKTDSNDKLLKKGQK